jgi:hypothetical protein
MGTKLLSSVCKVGELQQQTWHRTCACTRVHFQSTCCSRALCPLLRVRSSLSGTWTSERQIMESLICAKTKSFHLEHESDPHGPVIALPDLAGENICVASHVWSRAGGLFIRTPRITARCVCLRWGSILVLQHSDHCFEVCVRNIQCCVGLLLDREESFCRRHDPSPRYTEKAKLGCDIMSTTSWFSRSKVNGHKRAQKAH